MAEVRGAAAHFGDGTSHEVEWIAEYEARYGDLTAEWFASKDGDVLQNEYAAYLRDHTVTASWVCAPAEDSDGEWTPGAIIPQS